MLSLTLALSDSRKAGAIVTLQERRRRQPAGRHHKGAQARSPEMCGEDPHPFVPVHCFGPRDPHLGVPTCTPGVGHWGGGQILASYPSLICLAA